MWTKITNTNTEFIKIGTSICQDYNSNTDNTLETIYKVEIIHICGDIQLNTEQIANVRNISGKRIVNHQKLIDEGWFIFL